MSKHKTLTGYDFREDAALTPLKAMRQKCLDCAGSPSAVKGCEHCECPLWPYRLGRSPNRPPRVLTDAQKAEVAERLRKGRESKRQNRAE